jgi:putative colanic acid biosynthesis UDP-glucose lipid carrier transferase
MNAMSKLDAAPQPAASLGRTSLRGVSSEDGVLSTAETSNAPLAAVISLWGAALFYEGGIPPHYLILSVLVFALTFPGQPFLRLSTRQMIAHVVFNWAWVAGLLLLTGFVTGYLHLFSRQALTAWFVAAPLTELALGFTVKTLAPAIMRIPGPIPRAIIVGLNGQGAALAKSIRQSPYTRIDLLGFVDSRSRNRLDVGDHKLIGKSEELAKIVREQNVQLIYLSLPMASQPRILQILDDLKDTTASIYFVPDMFVTDLIQGRQDSVCGTPVISVCDTPFRGTSGLVKRISDIILSTLILLLISPVLLIVAIGVRMSSPGPIIFKQRRYGLDGKEILVYKFRSMSVTEDGDKQYTQVVRGDARVTPFGAFIRKTSLDELPQFINVLQGRMSIVGPRPHAVAVNENYRKLIQGYMVRHKVKPGITGWAQVNGYRGGDDLEHMKKRIEFDLDYLRHWSLKLDLYIILKTVRLVAKDSTAH